MHKKFAYLTFIVFCLFHFSIAYASDFPEEFNGLAFGATLPSDFKLVGEEIPQGPYYHSPWEFYVSPNKEKREFFGYKASSVTYSFEDKIFIQVEFHINEKNLAKVANDFTTKLKSKPTIQGLAPESQEKAYIYTGKKSGVCIFKQKENDKNISVVLYSRVFGWQNQQQ